MKVLFSNDDGYDAVGLATLYRVFKGSSNYDSFMCAPISHKSAFSHAINCHKDLEIQKLSGDIEGYALDGTPADCTRSALGGLFDFDFDLVLSGVNYGANIAHDIFYSGTIGAAREATFHGVLGIALSLDVSNCNHQVVTDEIVDYFQYTAKITKTIIDALPKELLSYKESIININFPYLVPAKGIKLADLGLYIQEVELYHSKKEDKDFLALRNAEKTAETGLGTDIYHLREGYIVVTALHKGIIYDSILQSKLAFMEKIEV